MAENDGPKIPGVTEVPADAEQSPTLRARFRAMRDDEDVRSAVRGGALFVGGLALNAPVTVGVTAYVLASEAAERRREHKVKAEATTD